MKISDFKLVDRELDKDKFDQLVNGFNQTDAVYPRNSSIHAVFQERALEVPENIAVVHNSRSITYRELDERSSRLASFLTSKGVRPEDPVALVLDRSIEMVVALLGILKAGAAYLPVNIDFPFERIRYILDDTACSFLISEKKYIRIANSLQWECPALKAFLCIDSDGVLMEKEPFNELMEKELWDFVGERATDEISGGGWINSYTGEDLSRKVMDEYADNVLKKLSPFVSKQSRVLEIACSSGITMFKIAPLAGEYVGTDLSSEILAKTEKAAREKNLGNIRLKCIPAHEIDRLGETGFDVIILNSVIQCFNGHNYLRDVIRKAISLLGDKGIIFAGDIMDQDKKQELTDSLIQFRLENIGKGYTTKTDCSNELFVSRRFFDDLVFSFPEIELVEHSEKIFTEESELTRFRYDTVIRVNKTSKNIKKGQPARLQFGRNDLEGLGPDKELLPVTHSGGLAAVIYTSGSTGRPKGVLVEHKGILRLVINANHMDFSAQDRVAQSLPLSFDPSALEIWGALLNGAGLYIIDKEVLLSFDRYGQMLKENKISIALLPAALFREMAEYTASLFSGLRILHVGGDVLSPHHVNKVRKENPGLIIINGYGPTENTTLSTYFRVEKDCIQSVPIGKPVSNTRCYILNKEGNPQPVGIAGELCVSGDGLARGYLNDPELTASKFVDHPFVPGEKMYRTGDQARWMPDGNIEFLGRMDLQVKINGFRVELSEIENVIRSLGAVKDVVVADRIQAAGDRYLCAYIIPNGSMELEDLKLLLSSRLPEYMVPSHFMVMEQFPLNQHGKTNRKALPDPARENGNKSYVPPSSDMERLLVRTWENLLERERIGVQDNFFQLGGNSLKATRLVSVLYRESGIKLELRDVFAHPVISELAIILGRSGQSYYQPIERVRPQEYYDVSHAQKRLWVLSQVEESSVSYNMPAAYVLKGDLNVPAFVSAFGKLIERHESLRTVFIEIEGAARQRILPAGDCGFRLEILDLRNDPLKEMKVREAAAREVSWLFDLRKGPLLRASLLRMSDGEYTFLLNMHHIISDGWSVEVLVKEVLGFYESYSAGQEPDLPALKIQYKDYAAWQNTLAKEALARQKDYWLDRLRSPVYFCLPSDRERPRIQSYKGDRVSCALPKDLSRSVNQYCSGQDATLFMFFLASVKVLFYRYAGQEDILLGTPVAGREHPDLEDQIGFYVNSLALRTQIRPADSFEQVIAGVKETCLGAFSNQAYPFDQLVDDLNLKRDISGSPLFNITVAMNSWELGSEWSEKMKGITIEPYPQEMLSSMYDLSIRFLKTPDDLFFSLDYNTDIFNRSTLERLAAHLQALMGSVISDPCKPVSALTFMDETERDLVLENFNLTELDFPRSASLPELFRLEADKYPSRIAVVDGEKTLTYKELDEKSDRLAAYLCNYEGVLRGDRIGLLTGRSVSAIVGMLGILKAGAAYVPIDPDYPEERVAFIHAQAAVRLIRADNAGSRASCVLIEDAVSLGFTLPSPGSPFAGPESLAYVIFTSGTTGRPKGVMIPHRAVVNLVHGLRHCIYTMYGEPLRIALLASFVFDASVQQIFASLLSGHSLYIVPDGIRQDGNNLAAYYTENRIDITDGTPAHLQLLTDALPDTEKQLPLKHCIIGGDVLPGPLVEKFYSITESKGYKGPRISNVYGPTECCVDVTHFLIDEAGKTGKYRTLPVGKPMPNRKAYILDSRLEPVPLNVWGELYIGGEGLSTGYIGMKELTGERFIPDPFGKGVVYKTGDICRWLPDGNIEFKGRNDSQVKIRGYRIEPGEIEKVLLSCDKLKDAAVVVKEDNEGSKYLAAYLVPENADIDLISAHLRKYLPGYMIPSVFVPLAKFPLNASGKVDRKALPEPVMGGREGVAYTAFRNNVEEKLTEIWKELLKKEKIGVHDSFFEIGGHSIKAVRLVSQIQKSFNVRLHLRDIFMHPSIEAQANVIRAATWQNPVPIEPLSGKEHYDLSHAQKRLWLLQQLDTLSTAYNIPGAVIFKGDLDREALRRAFETLAERHESLRTSFVLVDGEPRQKIIPAAGFSLMMEEIDLAADPEREKKAGEYAMHEINTSFDLSKDPLIRLKLLKLGEERYLFLFTMHHIISDGWSYNVLLKEIRLLYNSYAKGGENPLRPLRVQYKDFAHWQNRQLMDENLKYHRDYWLAQFGEAQPLLKIPSDHARPEIPSFRGDFVMNPMPQDLIETLNSRCMEFGVTSFMMLQAIVKTLLYRYTGQTDITVGSSIAGREHPDLEEQIGFFVNTLALRSRFSETDSFLTLLREVKKTTLEAYEHQVYPFDRLVEDLKLKRDTRRSPLFDVMVEMHNISSDEQGFYMDKVELSHFEQKNTTSRFDLIFNFNEVQDGGMVGSVEYSTDLFTRETVEIMYSRLLKLAYTVLAEPYITLRNIDIRLDFEKEREEKLKQLTALDESF